MNQKEIAKALNVTQATVSMALHNSPRISQELKQRIQDLAKESGYRLNLAGQLLRKQRSNFIGILFPSMASSFFGELYHELKQRLSQKGYVVYVSESSSDETTRDAVTFLRQLNVAGIISYGWSLSVLQEECPQNLPLVLFDGDNSDGMNFSHIRMDFSDAIRQIARLFYESGVRHPATIGPDHALSRFQPFYDYFHTQNIEPMELLSKPYPSQAYSAVTEFIQAGTERFDGVLCYNDDAAMGVLRALSENGIRVPENLLLAGYDNIEPGVFFSPSITTVDLNIPQIADSLVSEILRVIEFPELEHRKTSLPCRLLLRESSNRQSASRTAPRQTISGKSK